MLESFKNDPEWIAIKAESVRDGELVASTQSVFMQVPDFPRDSEFNAHLLSKVIL